jgi:hypothetical protein
VIRIEAGAGRIPFNLKMTVEGMAIYLDNFAVIGLAKGDAVRRARFINVLKGGVAKSCFQWRTQWNWSGRKVDRGS